MAFFICPSKGVPAKTVLSGYTTADTIPMTKYSTYISTTHIGLLIFDCNTNQIHIIMSLSGLTHIDKYLYRIPAVNNY